MFTFEHPKIDAHVLATIIEDLHDAERIVPQYQRSQSKIDSLRKAAICARAISEMVHCGSSSAKEYRKQLELASKHMQISEAEVALAGEDAELVDGGPCQKTRERKERFLRVSDADPSQDSWSQLDAELAKTIEALAEHRNRAHAEVEEKLDALDAALEEDVPF